MKTPRFTHGFLVAACLIGWVENGRAHTAAEEMAEAAGNLLKALTPEQKQKAVFELKSEERDNWFFIPKERKGITLKELKPWQRPLVHGLLASGLSQRGLLKAETITSLEEVLREMESKDPRMTRDPELYYVSIFGTPGPSETWGWRFEGHHLSVNFTLAGGREIAATPSFFGSNPAEVKEGPRRGLRVLGAEEDLGRQLLKSLNDDQKKAAIIQTNAPREIITTNSRKVQPLEQAGLAAEKMDLKQREALLGLIKEYVYRHRAEVADKDLARINQAGFEKIHFAWAGGMEPGQGHYYRIQGPTFLMEYDNTQNDNNHIHSVWRDFEHDFGRDLLREHYDATPHPK